MKLTLSTIDLLLPVILNRADASTVLPWAALLARSTGSQIRLAYIVDPARQEASSDSSRAMAGDAMALAATYHGFHGAAVDWELRVGLPEEEVAALATANPNSLLVVSANPPGSPLFTPVVDNVIERILSRLSTPLLVVPSGAPAPASLARVVLGADRSSLSQAIISLAEPVAQALNVEVVMVEVVEPGSLPGHEFVAIKSVIEERRILIRGHAAESLLGVARIRDAQLIVEALHEEGPLNRAFRGSGAGALLRNTDRPVLLVPEQAVLRALETNRTLESAAPDHPPRHQ